MLKITIMVLLGVVASFVFWYFYTGFKDDVRDEQFGRLVGIVAGSTIAGSYFYRRKR